MARSTADRHAFGPGLLRSWGRAVHSWSILSEPSSVPTRTTRPSSRFPPTTDRLPNLAGLLAGAGQKIMLPSCSVRADHVRVMHPVSEVLRPVLGRTSWQVKRGYGSFITMEYGEPHVDAGRPRLRPVSVEGGPAKALQRRPVLRGDWHLWIYCCEWSLLLEDTQLAHNESDDGVMHRALRVLDGQALQAVDIEPGNGRTSFTFDLGCSLLTYPALPGAYRDEPVEQWMLYSGSGPDLTVLTISGNGTYSITDGHAKPEDQRWLPIATTVGVRAGE